MLRALMIRKKLDEKRSALEELCTANNFEKREKDLEGMINEAQTEEEKRAVEEEVEKFEKEKKEHEEKEASLRAEIEKLEKDLESVETGQTEAEKSVPQENGETRKADKRMETRKFFGMSMQERDAFFANDEVKSFLERMREAGKAKRNVTGTELLIPTVVLNLIRENISAYSKLIKHVNMRAVPGKARQRVMGVIPEAVWTEMCGKLNELNLGFSGVEVDGYKVGGYIAVCNPILEDSDIALATEIISAIGKAIGLALDKAILYGTGTKMPLGIVTRLTQTAEPSGYSATIPWKDLHTSNVLSISGKTDLALFKALVENSGAAKGKYSNGEKFWTMNEATHTKLIANSLSINAAGAITAGVNGTMPIIGGEIEELSFIPDNVIIGGYGDLYFLAERADANFAVSEHVQFIEDNTVFKGTARYDGIPVIAEGFIAIDIAGGTISANAVTFAADTANAVSGGTSGGND